MREVSSAGFLASLRLAPEVPLPAGVGICLDQECGWVCTGSPDGQLAMEHTRATAHPTLHSPIEPRQPG